MTSLITTADDGIKEAEEAYFRACGNESINIEYDAEFFEGSDDEEGSEINEKDNDSEPENIVWSPELPGLEHEIGYTVGLDAHTSGDEGPEEREFVRNGSNCPDIPHSHITIQDNTKDPDEADTTDVTANQFQRRDTSPEQPSLPNLHPDNGSTVSAEEQLIRDGGTILDKYEELKEVGEAAEKKIKILNKKISANQEQLRLVLQSASSEEYISKMAPLYSEVVIQEGKRKMEEQNKADAVRKKAKLVAKLLALSNATSNQFEAQLRTTQRRKAASEYTPQ